MATIYILLALATVAVLSWFVLVPSFTRITLRKHSDVSWVRLFFASIALTPLCSFVSGSADRGVLFAIAVIAACWALAFVQAWHLRSEGNAQA